MSIVWALLQNALVLKMYFLLLKSINKFIVLKRWLVCSGRLWYCHFVPMVFIFSRFNINQLLPNLQKNISSEVNNAPD